MLTSVFKSKVPWSFDFFRRHFASNASTELSPAVRHLLYRHNLNSVQIKGSGKHGRILKGDILQYIASSPRNTIETPKIQQVSPPIIANISTPASKTTSTQVPSTTNKQKYEDIPNSNMRKIIAKRLSESKSTIPHVYSTAEIVLDQVMELRANLNAKINTKISINDFILRACALALKEVPQANASWDENIKNGENIKFHKTVDLSVAVATERGLITPIVKNADMKGLQAIANEVKELSTKAHNNKLLPEEYKGGTFSISNLGMFGIDEFAAVINPPQAAILAVGSGKKVPYVRVNESNNQQSISIATVMKVTLSCDGRVIDEELAFKLLNSIKRYLENPYLMTK